MHHIGRKLAAAATAIGLIGAAAVTISTGPANAATGTLILTAYSANGLVAVTTTLTDPTNGACYPINQPTGLLAWTARSTLDRAVQVSYGPACTNSATRVVYPYVNESIGWISNPQTVKIGL
ncbi:hypothetical protein OG792_19360 [Micromonospora sp. NBC_01699]|uniref:hypothetical protein n=1 Tax=Micromonospora sp. NBC_01699 TaxID=2975984 RepID=UPI002E2D6238|nr:hypothetical protein [Micromonospora sp. NBC_01699]